MECLLEGSKYFDEADSRHCRQAAEGCGSKKTELFYYKFQRHGTIPTYATESCSGQCHGNGLTESSRLVIMADYSPWQSVR